MDENSSQSSEAPPNVPSREELNAELLEVPPLPDQPNPLVPLELDHILTVAIGYVRGRRGGDLLAIILVGSGARRSLTPNSDLDLIALVAGQDEWHEIVRVADRLIEIRYRGHKAVEEELEYVARLPPLLRKGRVLFEHEAVGSKLVEKAQQRFRQSPPRVSLNEKIRLKADCLHWLGKAEDLLNQPATAQYLLGHFSENLLEATFRLRGYWLTSPADMLNFLSARDPALGDLLHAFMTAPTLPDRINVGRKLADRVFRDVPNPARVD